jgi:hypothetical protein
VICEECGETNKSRTEFCMFCGAYMGWQDEQNPSGGADVTQPMPAQPAARPAAQSSPPAAVPAAGPPPQAAPTVRQASQPQPSQPYLAPQQPARPQPAARPTGPGQRGPNAQNAPTAQYAATAPTAQYAATAAGAPPVDPRALAASTAPAAPAVAICPTCDREVDEGRRFCGHCGTQFIGPGASGAPLTRPVTKRETWWTRLWNRKDRGSRRAFRRSLPPLYRWRRVIFVVLALVLIGGGLTLVGRSPKSFVLARYYDLKGTLVPVAGVTATIIPPEASAAGTKPESLVDGTAEAWQMNWSDTTKGSPCQVTPTTPVIELTFDRTRIRAIDLRAGLLAKNPSRLLQFRPQNIWIAYADQCKPFTLLDVERQPVALDTKVPVDSIRIGVETAIAPAQPAGAQPVLGFTEITLQSRPRVR